MISTSGMSPILALKLLRRESVTFENGVKNDAIAKREIESFKEKIAGIKSVDDLMKDQATYSFVMKAFGLEGEIYAKAMIKKILTSDPDDKESLVSRLTKTEYKELNAAMKFKEDGSANTNHFSDQEWVDSMVDSYVSQRIIDNQTETNPVVGEALSFLKDAGQFTNWYKVISNEGASNVMRVALGLPDSLKSADVDAQKRAFEKKMNIEDLKDPKVLDSIVNKYSAIQAANQAAMEPAGILSLFQMPGNFGSFTPVTIDVSAATAISRYRL